MTQQDDEESTLRTIINNSSPSEVYLEFLVIIAITIGSRITIAVPMTTVTAITITITITFSPPTRKVLRARLKLSSFSV